MNAPLQIANFAEFIDNSGERQLVQICQSLSQNESLHTNLKSLNLSENSLSNERGQMFFSDEALEPLCNLLNQCKDL